MTRVRTVQRWGLKCIRSVTARTAAQPFWRCAPLGPTAERQRQAARQGLQVVGGAHPFRCTHTGRHNYAGLCCGVQAGLHRPTRPATETRGPAAQSARASKPSYARPRPGTKDASAAGAAAAQPLGARAAGRAGPRLHARRRRLARHLRARRLQQQLGLVGQLRRRLCEPLRARSPAARRPRRGAALLRLHGRRRTPASAATRLSGEPKQPCLPEWSVRRAQSARSTPGLGAPLVSRRTSEKRIRNSWPYFMMSSGFRRTVSLTGPASCGWGPKAASQPVPPGRARQHIFLSSALERR